MPAVRLHGFLMTPASVQSLDKLAPRFSQRNGGYTRIVRLGFRKGDRAGNLHARTGRFRTCETR